jgi:hypothetical protein
MAGARQQRLQQRRLARRQLQNLVAEVDRAALAVPMQAAEAGLGGRGLPGGRAPAVQRAQARLSAPLLRPITRSPTVPRAVRISTGVAKPLRRASSSTSRPSMPGRVRSSITTSGGAFFQRSRARRPSPQSSTSIPRLVSVRCSAVCIDGSSSTRRSLMP